MGKPDNDKTCFEQFHLIKQVGEHKQAKSIGTYKAMPQNTYE